MSSNKCECVRGELNGTFHCPGNSGAYGCHTSINRAYEIHGESKEGRAEKKAYHWEDGWGMVGDKNIKFR
jgi:hypothetical protein